MAHGPEPGTILNEGEPTEPRPASTVIVLRGGAETLELLLVQRTPKARFMGGAWVFPGGAVDAGEDHRAAALRELQEEAGLRIEDPGQLVPLARWITPPEVSIRFDTLFFLVPAPAGQEAEPDGEETVGARWIAPADALAGADGGELLMVFPTIKTIEGLVRFGSADEALEWAARQEIKPVEPRVVDGRIVLDDDGQ
jgi:8-oxo-dGTP pyrophosphatase MutT (NUDIX family)